MPPKWVITYASLLSCALAIFGARLCLAQESAAPDRAVAAAAFEAVAKRHTAPGPLALECSRFRRGDKASLGAIAADLPRIEGVKTTRIDGRELATLKKGTLIWDGADRWRIEWLSLTTGGPERARTAVMIFTPSPFSTAMRATLPRTSSASYPAISRRGMLKASTISRMR